MDAVTKLHVLRPHLPTGPVRRGECSGWQFQCNLVGCRYNLRHADRKEGDDGGTPTPVPMATVMRYRSCALNIADEPPEMKPAKEPARSREQRASTATTLAKVPLTMRTQEDVAALLGVTREAVKIIEARALRKLAQATAAQRAYRESEGIADRAGASLPSSLEE